MDVRLPMAGTSLPDSYRGGFQEGVEVTKGGKWDGAVLLYNL